MTGLLSWPVKNHYLRLRSIRLYFPEDISWLVFYLMLGAPSFDIHNIDSAALVGVVIRDLPCGVLLVTSSSPYTYVFKSSRALFKIRLH